MLRLVPSSLAALLIFASVGCNSSSGKPGGTDGGSGGAIGSGGTGEKGGQTGSGGASSSGSVVGSGGKSGTGGRAGSGGATGGKTGTGGFKNAGGSTISVGGSSGATGDNTGGKVGTGGKSSSGGASGTGGAPGTCDQGTKTTTWATNCPTEAPTTCTAGTWVAGGPDPDNASFKLLSESTHFAVYSDESPSGAQAAADFLEKVWSSYFGSPMFMREPLCNSTTKTKVSIHVHSDWGLTGGSWGTGRMGMWIGSNGLSDHWGLAHEFMHGVQAVQGGMSCSQSNTCGWIWESHANWSPQQLVEYHTTSVHCSELMVNAPHLYLGSTRDRYCNWQFMEYLKDKYCMSAVNAIWTGAASNDPFTAIMKNQGWDIGQLNDFLGEWAMHNVTWDYQDPEPQSTAGGNQGAFFRKNYGLITDTNNKSKPERRIRLAQLEPLNTSWMESRRFQSPYFWAPQRFGYNIVRLIPDGGATSVTVTFRGVTGSANTDWRWGLVATDSGITTPRYSALQKGSDGALTFCVGSGESLWLVVMATPSVYQQIVWDQAYASIPRYPYMVELAGAWPDGFQGGMQAACPSGLTRIANGGGCGPSSLPASVFVGPYATILGGTVSGDARIDDHATVFSGTVSGGTVSALSIVSNFTVGASATAKTTFYPLGHFESGNAISGSALIYGDVEFRGPNYTLTSTQCSGYIAAASSGTPVSCGTPGGLAPKGSTTITDVTTAPPYTWRL
jgi:hypothetical protein